MPILKWHSGGLELERPICLAACKTLASSKSERACSRLSAVRFANGPKRSMGHVMGAGKGIFLIRGRGRPTVFGRRAGGILSIPAQEVSLGSPRVGTIHVHAPTPHTPPLQSFLVDFSQQTTRFSHLLAMVLLLGLSESTRLLYRWRMRCRRLPTTSAGRRLRLRRLWMKTGLELI